MTLTASSRVYATEFSAHCRSKTYQVGGKKKAVLIELLFVLSFLHHMNVDMIIGHTDTVGIKAYLDLFV